MAVSVPVKKINKDLKKKLLELDVDSAGRGKKHWTPAGRCLMLDACLYQGLLCNDGNARGAASRVVVVVVVVVRPTSGQGSSTPDSTQPNSAQPKSVAKDRRAALFGGLVHVKTQRAHTADRVYRGR